MPRRWTSAAVTLLSLEAFCIMIRPGLSLLLSLPFVLYGAMMSAEDLRLMLPEAVKGATLLPLSFSAVTEEGDRITYVHDAMDWEVMNVEIPADKTDLRLPAPSDPGVYSVFWQDANGEVRAETALSVTPADIRLDALDRAPAGSRLRVEWYGPSFPGDRVYLYREADDAYLIEVLLQGRNPIMLPLDVPPGPYELLYWYEATKSIMVRRWITVEGG